MSSPTPIKIDIEALARIPTVPAIVLRLVEALADPDVPLQELSNIIKSDPAITSRLVKAANSAMYAGMSKADTLDRCVLRLGRNAVGCLAQIEQWDVPHPNLFALLARGVTRFRVLETQVAANGLISGRIETLPEPTRPAIIDRACQEVLRLAVERAGVDSVPGPLQFDDPVWVSYRLAEILPIATAERQALLEETDTGVRLTRIRALLHDHGIIENINKNK